MVAIPGRLLRDSGDCEGHAVWWWVAFSRWLSNWKVVDVWVRPLRIGCSVVVYESFWCLVC
jgi:hypothetical protein